MNIILDTHILIWRLIEPKKLSPRAQKIIFDTQVKLLVPTITILEIQYLKEIGRLEVEMDDVLLALKEPCFKLLEFNEVVLIESLKLSSTRDPFDRIILAHALAHQVKIITKDRWMKKTASNLVIS